MRKIILCVVALIFSSLLLPIFACTSAIFTGKSTADGKPLMWKHRDTGEENNRMEFFNGEKYSFLALMNSPISKNGIVEAWTGTNDQGFSIMNTASYNLKDDDLPSKIMDKEGVLMYKALGLCITLEDFENFLNSYKKPIGVEANFGVIDAFGGAAYYEVNNNSWKKIDVNDPKIAPQGYLVYTNHSYTGRKDDGMGYIRYTTANMIILDRIASAGKITPEWIFSSLSRSFYHSILGLDLVKDNELLQKGSGWFIDQDFIPRKSSTASIVIVGVKKGENPLSTILWTILGYPPVSVAVPLFIAAAEKQPSFMLKSNDSNNAQICDIALEKKHNVFSIVRGNGNKYMNFNLLYNQQGSGYMQVLGKLEKEIFLKTNQIVKDFNKNGFDEKKLIPLYSFILDELKK